MGGEKTAFRRSMVMVLHGMVAMDVKKLVAGAVEAVEGRLIGIDGGAART